MNDYCIKQKMIYHHQETTIESDDLELEVTRLLIEIWLKFFGTWVQEDDVKYEMINPAFEKADSLAIDVAGTRQ